MADSKNFKWLRGIHHASNFDKVTELHHSITQNGDMTGRDDKFVYQCRSITGKLLADRKIDFGTAMILVNSWRGDVTVQEKAPAGR